MFKNPLYKYCVLIFTSVLIMAVGHGNAVSLPENGEIYVIRLEDATINPVTDEYIRNSIDRANEDNAVCLIMYLDTPGGLLTSTRSIVKKIMSSEVPVVVYIAPSGARAGSAGVFITYASHVAAMAPSTNIGAAHPVQIGGEDKKKGIWETLQKLIGRNSKEKNKKEIETENKTADTLSSKILNDTVAFIKAIAKERNRNIEWAELAVTQSSSITEQEALDKNVIEIIAKDINDLIEKLDKREVKIGNETVLMKTESVSVKDISMDFRQRILNVLANPNIAYIFMILGFYGLLYEVTHPGIGVPGIMGAIFLILAFYSMQTLPTNYAGLALIILAVILFIAEAYVPGFGLLTLGGILCMVLGSLLLFDSTDPAMRVSLKIVISLSVATGLITAFLARSVILSHKKKVISGKEGLVGENGEAYTFISKDRKGKVFVHGEIWTALSDETINKGDDITVVEVIGMKLKVKKA